MRHPPPTTDPCSETVTPEYDAVIDGFRSGDPDAVARIYDEFARPVWSVAHSVLGDAALADDTTQETFVRAWRAADRFTPGRPLGPWLFTIARRTAIDVHRRERRPTRGDHDEERDVAIETPGIDASWERWEIQHALGELPDDERELVRLSHYLGLTHAQIAEWIGVPLGTVKSRSHRAHRRLAARLRHLLDEEGRW